MAISYNVVRIAALLNEKGLDYELVVVDLSKGDHKKPEFLAINPFGLIPAFQDGDELLFESRAITSRPSTRRRALTCSDAVGKAGGVAGGRVAPVLPGRLRPGVPGFQLFLKPIFGGEPDPIVVDKHSHMLAKVLDIYDAHLAKTKYLAGDRFTLADLNHMAHLFHLSLTPKAELITSRPHVKAWWDDMSARPAWKKTVAAIPLPPAA